MAFMTSLAWTATGATTVDVAFGTSNPPAAVVTASASTTSYPRRRGAI